MMTSNSILLKNFNTIISANEQGLIKDNKSYLYLEDEIIKSYDYRPSQIEIDCKGKMITPGFVDPHTHPVFLNTRHDEFIMRLKGMSYKQIAKNGGGIISTIDSVNKSSEENIIDNLMLKMDEFIRFGTTTIEAKSGYGLSVDGELKSLSCLESVNKDHAIDIIPTFMGAHAFPKKYQDNPNNYVDIICNEMIPKVADQGIAIFNDVFCEKGYFDIDQTRKIIECGKNFGLKPRLHVDEFEDIGGIELAIEAGAVSVDHLMASNSRSIDLLSKSNVIATLLPGTSFFLNLDDYAPAREIIDKGVSVALATDYNPGSSHMKNMSFIILLSTMKLKMSIEEAFVACTYNAAKSLQLEDSIGSISIGKKADLIIWDIETLEEIPYYFMDAPIQKVIKNGKIAFEA